MSQIFSEKRLTTMSGESSKKPTKQTQKPLSLYGMKPEDALRKALSTPPAKNKANLPPKERAAKSLPPPKPKKAGKKKG
jgi:hypothetical protein